MIEFDEPLSPAGQSRREQILELARQAARSRRVRQHRRRQIAPLAAVVAVLLAASLIVVRSQSSHRPEIAVQPSPMESPAPTVERIATDPGIAARLSVLPKPEWQAVDDNELLQSFAAAGEPAGLIHLDDQTILLTDEESQ